MDKTSMLYWWPIVKDLNIPKPETVIIESDINITEYLMDSDADFLSEEGIKKHFDMNYIHGVCKNLGYPVFMRTDMTSNKHAWEKTCFVQKEADLIPHIQELCVFSQTADIFCGLQFKALVLRKFIKMDKMFTAFRGNMPIPPEYRFFIDRGVKCYHWYWPDEALNNLDVIGWKQFMDMKKREVAKEASTLLFSYAVSVAQFFKGCWSVDFCRGADGTWYLIDMAESSKSWHPEYCANHKDIRGDRI